VIRHCAPESGALRSRSRGAGSASDAGARRETGGAGYTAVISEAPLSAEARRELERLVANKENYLRA
jgi:hypothetical protein